MTAINKTALLVTQCNMVIDTRIINVCTSQAEPSQANLDSRNQAMCDNSEVHDKTKTSSQTTTIITTTSTGSNNETKKKDAETTTTMTTFVG